MASRVLEHKAVPLSSPSPLSVYLNRRLLYGLLYAVYFIRRLAKPNRKVFVVPTPPTRWHLLWLITAYLGVRVTTEPEESQLGCIHEDRTWVEQQPNESGWPKVMLNSRCLDISKRRVSEVHREIFGYNSSVDPTRHVGPMVRKSNTNARHDGQIIHGPINKRDSAYVYQELIDNIINNDTVVEYRLFTIDNTFPFAMIKSRPLSARFQSETSPSGPGEPSTSLGDAALPDMRPCHIEVVEPSTLFSDTELAQIAALTRKMGLDFGEIDILRDRISKCAHVIDVNKTPANSLRNWRTSFRIIRLAGCAFEKQFLRSSTPRLNSHENEFTAAASRHS